MIKLKKICLSICILANMVLITVLINQYTTAGLVKYLILPFSVILSFVSPPAGLAFVISGSTALGGITMNYPGTFLQALVGAVVLTTIALKRLYEKELFNNPFHIEDLFLVLLIVTIIMMGFSGVDFNYLQDYFTNLFFKKYSNEDAFWTLVFSSRWIYFVIFGAIAIRSSKELLNFIYFLLLGGVYQILAIPLNHYDYFYVLVCKMQGSIEGLQIFNTSRSEVGYYFALNVALSFLLLKYKNSSIVIIISLITINFLLTIMASSKGPLLSILIYMPAAIYLLKNELKKCFTAILFVMVISCGLFQVCNYGTFFTANYLNTIKPSIDSRISLYQGGIDVIKENSNLEKTMPENHKNLRSTDVQATFGIKNNKNDFDIYTMTGSGSGTHNLFFDIYINYGLFKSMLLLVLSLSLIVNLFINFKNTKSKDEDAVVVSIFYTSLFFIIVPKLVFSTAAHASMWPGIILGITYGLTKYYRGKIYDQRSI